MKKIFCLLMLLAGILTVYSQGPAILNYQGVARNSVGNVLVNKNISLRLTIHDLTATGAIVYQETRSVTTNPFGLFNIQIGSSGATSVTGTLVGVPWSAGNKFIQVEIDPEGGSFINIGAAQLASVPYALLATQAQSSLSSWNLTGNANTGSSQFIGTTDARNLEFRTNNTPKLRITQKGQMEILNTGRSVFIGDSAGANDDLTNNENVFLGFKSGIANVNGYYNTSVGSKSLFSNTNGFFNTAVGSEALLLNRTGNFNTSIGSESMYENITGSENTAVGASTLRSNTTGRRNTAIGYFALYANTTGSFNAANGDAALYSNTTGSNNTANGSYALFGNTTGDYNTANGTEALINNTTGTQNTGNGAFTLVKNTTGNENTASGAQALFFNTTGSRNTANGSGSLYKNSIGFDNTAMGFESLHENTIGISNTAIGAYSLASNTDGSENTAIGDFALFKNTTGERNTANGNASLSYNVSGIDNTSVGYRSISKVVTGSRNTALGSAALEEVTEDDNTGVGYKVLWSSTSSQNTAMGSQAMLYTTTGYKNTAVGFEAMKANKTGVYNTAIGSTADVSPAGNINNATAIGYDSYVSTSHKVVIGNTTVMVIGGYAGWSNLSDSRFKRNVQDDVAGLDFIMRLKPVTYNMDIHKLNDHFGKKYEGNEKEFMERSMIEKEKIVYSGFEAQEVEKAALTSHYNFSGVIKPQNEKDHYSIVYSDFIPSLVKAVQEQQQAIDDLKKENASIKEQLKKVLELVSKK